MMHSAEAQVNPILLFIIERLREILAHQCHFRSEHVGAYSVSFHTPVYSMCLFPQTRLHQEEGPTLTSRFVQRITTALLSTSTLDLNQAMPTDCELSKILSPTVRIRSVHPQKDCMPSGREVMLKLLQVLSV